MDFLQGITLPAAHLILNVSQKFGMCKKGILWRLLSKIDAHYF